MFLLPSLPFSLGTSRELSVDLGSAVCKIAVDNQIVLQQPTCIALHKQTQEVVAVGRGALELLGKVPPQIEVIFPVRRGRVQHIIATQLFVQYCVKSVLKRSGRKTGFAGMLVPSLRWSTPQMTSKAERAAILRMLREVGFPHVTLLQQLDATYQHLFQQKKVGRVFVLANIGAMHTEIGFYSQGAAVLEQTIEIGGNDFTTAIIHELQKEYHCQIGWQTAERMKISMGIVSEDEGDFLTKKMSVRGRDLLTSLPATAHVSGEIIARSYQYLIDDLIESMLNLFQDAAPELMDDGFDQGIILSGGGSLLKGIEKVIEKRLKTPVTVSETAIEDVVQGCT